MKDLFEEITKCSSVYSSSNDFSVLIDKTINYLLEISVVGNINDEIVNVFHREIKYFIYHTESKKICNQIYLELICTKMLQMDIDNRFVLVFLSATNHEAVKSQLKMRKKVYSLLEKEKKEQLGIERFKKSIYSKLK